MISYLTGCLNILVDKDNVSHGHKKEIFLFFAEIAHRNLQSKSMDEISVQAATITKLQEVIPSKIWLKAIF